MRLNKLILFVQKKLLIISMLFPLYFTNIAMAQTLNLPSYIESIHSWDDGELSWEDFKGKSEDTSAICDMQIRLFYSEEKITKWPVKYSYLKVSPRLYKLDSWVCDSLKTDLNLKYHQTVFDFSEVMCRRISLESSTTKESSEFNPIHSFYTDRFLKEVDIFKTCSNNGTIPDSVELYYNMVKKELSDLSVPDSIKNIPYNPYSSSGGTELVIGYNRQSPISKNPVISSTNGITLGVSYLTKKNVIGMQLKFRTGTSKTSMTTTKDSTININDTINSNSIALQYERKIIDNKYVSVGPFVSLGCDYKTKINHPNQKSIGEVDFLGIMLGLTTDFHFFSYMNLYSKVSYFNSLRFSPYLQYQQNKNYGKMLSIGFDIAYVWGLPYF